MSETFPVASVVEQSVNNQVNALVGNKDVNLNTIVKMSLLHELKPVPKEEMDDILSKIRANNELEHYYIQQEYGLTMDCGGNIISLDCINGKSNETDFESVVHEPKRCE